MKNPGVTLSPARQSEVEGDGGVNSVKGGYICVYASTSLSMSVI